MLLLFGIFLGCSDKGNDTGEADTAEAADTADTGEIALDCSQLSADECAGNDLCWSIMGYPLDIFEDDMCYEVGDPAAVGCMSVDVGCGDAITYATAPDGSEYMFMDTCTPAGWGAGPDLSMFVEGCAPVSADDCIARSIDECISDDACTHIFGARRVEANDEACYELEPMEPVGCMSAGDVCEPVVLNAADPSSGMCYQFNSGCTPAEWGTCDDAALSLPECALTCADYTPEQCVSQPSCSIIRASILEVDTAQECYSVGANEPVGCMDTDMICGDAITFAADADGLCMMFYDNCIPDGWSYCEDLGSYGECPS